MQVQLIPAFLLPPSHARKPPRPCQAPILTVPNPLLSARQPETCHANGNLRGPLCPSPGCLSCRQKSNDHESQLGKERGRVCALMRGFTCELWTPKVDGSEMSVRLSTPIYTALGHTKPLKCSKFENRYHAIFIFMFTFI